MSDGTPHTSSLTVGVIGVGSMGQHHARVYNEFPDVTLAGVTDEDDRRAANVAEQYGTVHRSRDELLDRCDAVSIVVPTRFHYEFAREAIERDVSVLVEKPFVSDLSNGRELVELAHHRNVTLQVGHIERFNPAIRAVDDIVSDLDMIALDVRRLGPPVNRDTNDSVGMDLMIHDIDIVLDIVDSEIESIAAMSAHDCNHITSQIEFENGVIANLTASRVTQEKVRELSITAQDCRVNIDYESQGVQIHRHSLPEYYDSDGDLRYRHESIIERPTIENGEPLKAELQAFIESVTTDSPPPVTGMDGVRALDVASRIESLATPKDPIVGQ